MNNLGYNKQIKIHIERKGGCYIDSNGLLKGEWGGYEEVQDCDTNGEKIYRLYYSKFSKYTEINEFGFFYNKFSCQKYDGVLKLDMYLYLCEKNNRLGLIELVGDEEHTILPIAYNEIKPYFDIDYIFIVKTETGKFLINLSSARQSEVYDDIFIVYDSVIYKKDKKYGFLNIHGQVLLDPICVAHKFDTGGLRYEFQGLYFDIFVKDDLLYGKIPLDKYDLCFRVGSNVLDCFYVTKKNEKYGLLSNIMHCISEPVLDEILLYKPKNKWSNGMYKTSYVDDKTGKFFGAILVMARIGEKYLLYNAENGKCIINDCDQMKYVSAHRDNGYDYVEYSKNGKVGYVSSGGILISPEEYDSIYIGFDFFYVGKNGKFGVLQPSGMELFPCVYDNISGNYDGEFELVRDGKKEKIRTEKSSHFTFPPERPTYGRYAGSYAQSEMGWSDDDIDTVLDGDPDAYWNID